MWFENPQLSKLFFFRFMDAMATQKPARWCNGRLGIEEPEKSIFAKRDYPIQNNTQGQFVR